MRVLLIALLAVALAVPAAAIADRGRDERAAGAHQQAAAKRKKHRRQKQLEARSAARIRSSTAARPAGATVGPRGELELKGTLTSLSPPTVGGLACAVPAGVTLAGFAVGDVVELECKLVAGTWTLHELELEDDHPRSRPGGSDDCDDHDDHDDDHSGRDDD